MWASQPGLPKNSAQPERKRRKAFTLIELLVVIAIISLLVSILVPSLTRAKGLAKEVVCAANAKGIGTALFLYADEHHDQYPMATCVGHWGQYVNGVSVNIYSWMEQLFPFVETQKLYVCPEKPNDSDYSYFLGSRAVWIDTNDYGPIRRNRIKYSSAYVLSGCTGRKFSFNSSTGQDDCDKDDYTQDCVGFPVHGEKQNILFDDGHVNAYEGYVENEMTFRYRKMAPWEEETTGGTD